MSREEGPEALRDGLREAWQRYVDMVAPLRPQLHGYCRRLTRDVWDAEDLVQDTLLRAFGHLGHLGQEVGDPKAYLLRTATNVWIDGLRRRDVEARALATEPAPAGTTARVETRADLRDAGGEVLGQLSPQERAAVVLKEAFDMPLAEIAALLATSVGAVKAALHRGRVRLERVADGTAPTRPVPSVALVDAFVSLWEKGDVPGLVGLLVEGGGTENVGCGLQYGRKAFEGTDNFLYKAVHGHDEWPEAFRPEAVRLERRAYEGEPMVFCYATRGGEEALEQILRIEEADGRIARLRGYAFCPEVMRAVAEQLGLPVRTGLYRFPTPEPGRYYGGGPVGRAT
jgi:RNA polymerase sigma-70 factor (ECF subfamily)